MTRALRTLLALAFLAAAAAPLAAGAENAKPPIDYCILLPEANGAGGVAWVPREIAGRGATVEVRLDRSSPIGLASEGHVAIDRSDKTSATPIRIDGTPWSQSLAVQTEWEPLVPSGAEVADLGLEIMSTVYLGGKAIAYDVQSLPIRPALRPATPPYIQGHDVAFTFEPGKAPEGIAPTLDRVTTDFHLSLTAPRPVTTPGTLVVRLYLTGALQGYAAPTALHVPGDCQEVEPQPAAQPVNGLEADEGQAAGSAPLALGGAALAGVTWHRVRKSP